MMNGDVSPKETRNPETFFTGLSIFQKDDQPLFTLLPHFVFSILIRPTSNADAERIFSKLNLTKAKVRNRLLTSSQANLVRVSEEANVKGVVLSLSQHRR